MTRFQDLRRRRWASLATAVLLASASLGVEAGTAAAAVLPPHIVKSFGAAAIPVNGTTPMSFAINNPNPTLTSTTNVGFIDLFPTGLAYDSTTSNGCGGTLTTISTGIELSGVTLAPGGHCTLTVVVKGTSLGEKDNTITVGSDQGQGNTSSATLIVAQPPSTFASFSKTNGTNLAWAAPSSTVALNVYIENPNVSASLSGVGFSSALPPNMHIATPNGLVVTGGCTSDEVAAVAGTSAVTLTGATLTKSSGDPANPAAGEACGISVNVIAPPLDAAPQYTTGTAASIEGGTGGAATASMAVIGTGPRVYWGNFTGATSGVHVEFAPLSGLAGAALGRYVTSGGITGTAIDAAAGRIYWDDQGTSSIHWSTLDDVSAGLVSVAGSGSLGFRGLAINPASGRLYWGGAQSNTISWANPHDASAGALYTSATTGGATLALPSGVAIDPAANRIYWTNGGLTNAGISYANLDGTGGGHDLSTTGATVDQPYGLVLDIADGLVYWANAGDARISYAHLDGSGGADLTILGLFVSNPEGLAFDSIANQIWWGNANAGSLGHLSFAPQGGAGAMSPPLVSLAAPAYPSILYPPQSTSAPTLTGSGKPGVQLTCGKGGWAPDLLGAFLYRVPQTFAYHWQRNGTAISGAASSTYTPSTTGDYTCTVTAANAAGPTTSPPSTVADSLPPSIGSLIAAPSSGSAMGSTVPVRLTWSASDAGSGIAHYEVWLSTNGGSYVKLSSPTSATYIRSLTPSSTTTYRFRVRAFDKAGNISGFTYSATFHVKLVQQTSTSLHWAGSWSTATTTSASGGSYRYASVAGASVSYTFAGRAVGVVATKGTAFGSFPVYLDGVLVGTVSDYTTSTLYRRIVYSKAWTSSATHTIKLVCLGTAGHPRIDLDAFVVLA